MVTITIPRGQQLPFQNGMTMTNPRKVPLDLIRLVSLHLVRLRLIHLPGERKFLISDVTKRRPTYCLILIIEVQQFQTDYQLQRDPASLLKYPAYL